MNEYPYWWDSLPADASSRGRFKSEVRSRKAEEAEPLALPTRADVFIVGAGYTGLAAALALARRGASVLVLERDHVGAGASSRNGGQVLTGLKLDAATLLARFGESGGRRLFDASIDAIARLEQLIADEHLDCDYQRSGHLDAANKPSHFAAFREEQALLDRVFRHRVEIVPPSGQRAEIGSDAYHGLMVDERSGSVNPARYVRELAAAACRAGATIAEGTAVTAMKRESRRWTVATSRGSIDAGDVLIATNGYTDRAAPWLQRRVIPIGSYIIATEPLADDHAATLIPRRRMVFDTKYFLHYYRLTRDNRLLFGGRAQFTQPTADTTRRSAAILREDMVAAFPSLADARIEYAWGGNVAFTRDQLPHAGRFGDAYYAAGYCGHGVAMGTYLGTTIARAIAGEKIDNPLVDRKFPAIPFYRGTPWFLPLVGAYYRVLDWLS